MKEKLVPVGELSGMLDILMLMAAKAELVAQNAKLQADFRRGYLLAVTDVLQAYREIRDENM